MINLLNRDSVSIYDPGCDVMYEYSVVFKEKYNDSYIYEFTRKRKSDVSDNVDVLLIEIYNIHDINMILLKADVYWQYYEKIYHNMKPINVYCKKHKNGDDLMYICHEESEIVAKHCQFNKVVNVIDANDGPKYGFDNPQDSSNYSPIFEINIWKDYMYDIDNYKPLLKSIIREYIKEIHKED